MGAEAIQKFERILNQATFIVDVSVAHGKELLRDGSPLTCASKTIKINGIDVCLAYDITSVEASKLTFSLADRIVLRMCVIPLIVIVIVLPLFGLFMLLLYKKGKMVFPLKVVAVTIMVVLLLLFAYLFLERTVTKHLNILIM